MVEAARGPEGVVLLSAAAHLAHRRRVAVDHHRRETAVVCKPGHPARGLWQSALAAHT